jgi:hypothetical protein
MSLSVSLRAFISPLTLVSSQSCSSNLAVSLVYPFMARGLLGNAVDYIIFKHPRGPGALEGEAPPREVPHIPPMGIGSLHTHLTSKSSRASTGISEGLTWCFFYLEFMFFQSILCQISQYALISLPCWVSCV